ncbi:MAG: NAD(+) synthase [Candidatus Obscuribacterales bacterium]|nr:NAD(+) synthase [Candidatus Obscuribacterales bacterium]
MENPRRKNLGMVKVGAGSHSVDVGNCTYNAESIIRMMGRAQEKKVRILFLNELGVTGYSCGDLFRQQALQDGAREAIEKVRVASESVYTGVVVIGAPLAVEGKLYNCAVVIHKGKVLGVVPKCYLPTYGEFHEGVWFRSGLLLRKQTMELNGQRVRIGIDLLFEAVDFPGLVLGIEICEDAWAVIPPHRLQALCGATIFGNLSASNETIGKDVYREQLVTGHSSEALGGYIYASAGEGESTVDVVYGGHLMIGELGIMLAHREPLGDEDDPLITADMDVEHLLHERERINSFADCADFFKPMCDSIGFERIGFNVEAGEPADLQRFVDARPFVPSAGPMLNKRCRQVFKIMVRGLRKRLKYLLKRFGSIEKSIAWMKTSGKPLAVMGVSGGADSTEVLVVAVKAFDELGIPREFLHCYALPGFGTTRKTYDNSIVLMKLLGVTMKEVNIRARCLLAWQEEGYKPFGIDVTGMTLEAFVELLKKLPKGSKDLGFENKQARARTDILMNAGFVIGTGDLSEQAAGWATYNADHMSMYNPNAGVPKTLVNFLIKWVAENEFDGELRRVLIDIAETEVSPELLPPGPDGKIAQKTNETIGPADLRDFFLYHMVRWGSRPGKIVQLCKRAKFYNDYTETEIRKWLRVFIERFFDQRFKPECQPGGPLVGSVSLNPRYKWHHVSDMVGEALLKDLDADTAAWQASQPPVPVTPTGGVQIVLVGEPAEGTGTLVGVDGRPLNNTVVPAPAVNLISPSWVSLITRRRPPTSGIVPPHLRRVLRVLGRIDMQKDFMPGGPMGVTQGDEIIMMANCLARYGGYDLVIDTFDDHDDDHGSFACNHEGKTAFVDEITLYGILQKLWAKHSVKNTDGWKFHPKLDASVSHRAWGKGRDSRVDSYSCFFDNGRKASAAVLAAHPFLGQSTGLAEFLIAEAEKRGCDEIHMDFLGLALEYCVGFSAIDATTVAYRGTKIRARVIHDVCKAFDQTPEAYERHLKWLKAEGVEIVEGDDVLHGRV